MSERKPASERVNRNPRVFPDTVIIWDGKTRGKPLKTYEGEQWSAATLDWWEYVRNSPQAMLFQDSDWYVLRIAAKLHNQMHSLKKVYDAKTDEVHEIPCTPGELKACASEFRTYIDTYGFTRQSRVRYGINIVTEDDLETEAVQAQIQSAQVVVDYRKKYSE